MDARACATDGLASGRGRGAGRRRRLRQSPGGAHHLLVAGLPGEPRADAQDAGPGPRRLGWAAWTGTRQGQSRLVGHRRPAQPRMSSPGCRALCHEPGLGYRHCAFHRCQWLLAPVAGPSPGWAAPRWPRVGVGRWQARDVQLPAPLAFPVLSLSGLHRRGRLLAVSAIRRMLTESSLAGRGRGCRTAGRSARGDSIRRPGARRMSTPGHAGGRAQPPG